MPAQNPISINLTANLSGTWPNPTAVLVASGSNSTLWDQGNQCLGLSGLPKVPPPPAEVNVTIVIGTVTIAGAPSVRFSATGPITFNPKSNPNAPPPPGLFKNIVVSADGQTLSFTDKNGDGGDYKFLLNFVLGAPVNGTFVHDPEIQNTGQSSDG
jgi:hypothetical protein